MRIYATAAVAALCLVAGSCADAPTKPQADALTPEAAPLLKRSPGGPNRAAALTNVPVTMPATFASGAEGVFRGTFTATRVDVVTNPTTGKRQATVTGWLTGVAKTADGSQSIDVPATLVTGVLTRGEGTGKRGGVAVKPAQSVCDILFLDLGPIHLDLLGLVLNVSRIIIDLDAQTGPGNLLGNLLCALLGLLDLPGLLGAITRLLELINSILSGVGGGGMAAA